MLSQPFIGGVMTDFTREEIRSQLHMQGFDPPEPEFTEVVYRINALIEGLRAIQFSNAIPMRANACAGWAANRRQAAAMLVCPAHLSSPIAVLRSAAMTWGMLPERTWERSSSNVTSRTQCDWFSICHCPRTSSSKRVGVARSGRRLVTP